MPNIRPWTAWDRWKSTKVTLLSGLPYDSCHFIWPYSTQLDYPETTPRLPVLAHLGYPLPQGNPDVSKGHRVTQMWAKVTVGLPYVTSRLLGSTLRLPYAFSGRIFTTPARSRVGYPAMLQRRKSIAVLLLLKDVIKERKKKKKRREKRREERKKRKRKNPEN